MNTHRLKKLFAAAVVLSIAGSGPAASAKSAPTACTKPAQAMPIAVTKSFQVMGGGGGLTELNAAIRTLQTYASNAPSAIKGDLKVFTDAYVKFTGEVSPTGSSDAQIASYGKLLNSPKVALASNHLYDWFRSHHCGGV